MIGVTDRCRLAYGRRRRIKCGDIVIVITDVEFYILCIIYRFSDIRLFLRRIGGESSAAFGNGTDNGRDYWRGVGTGVSS